MRLTILQRRLLDEIARGAIYYAPTLNRTLTQLERKGMVRHQCRLLAGHPVWTYAVSNAGMELVGQKDVER